MKREILEGRFPAEFPKIARGSPMASSVGESAADTSAARACTRACPTTKSGFINSQAIRTLENVARKQAVIQD